MIEKDFDTKNFIPLFNDEYRDPEDLHPIPDPEDLPDYWDDYHPRPYELGWL